MSRHVVVLGDIGADGRYQVGDEAMVLAARDELDAREDLRWTVVSGAPRETARHGVDAVGRFGFGGLATRDERERRLAALTAAARGGRRLTRDDPAQPLLDAVAGADAVLIAGGRLSSEGPEHVYERAALAAAAGSRPVVLTGQRLGPRLDDRDGVLVAAVLTGAQFVGVRDRASADLAGRLGVAPERLRCSVDDAAFLADLPCPELLGSLGLTPGGFVAATFSDAGATATQQVAEQLGTLLAGLVERSGLDVVLVPHLGDRADLGDAGPRSTHDRAFHALVAAAAKTERVRALPVLPAREVAWLTRQAAMVVSSRDHPVVFGLSVGIPAVGVSTDDDTERALRGALSAGGLDSWCVSVLGLRNGVLEAAVEEAWQRRDELGAHVRGGLARQRSRKADYWDAVHRALLGQPAAGPGPDLPPEDSIPALGAWSLRNDDALHWDRMFCAHRGTWQREGADTATRLQVALDQLQHERLERCRAADRVSVLREDLAVERAGAAIARADRADQLGHALRQSAEYTALQQTKLLRWTRSARAVYGALRRDRA